MANMNEFLKKDIKDMIKTAYHSVGYIRGYMAACYNTGHINKETLAELKEYLAKNIDNIMKVKGVNK